MAQRSFTQADTRLFVVTFAGTVTANIVTVVAVTLVIIAARSPLVQKPNVGLVLSGSLVVVIGTMMVVATITSIRHGPRPGNTKARVSVALTVAFIGGLALLTLAMLLTLISFAVRVK